MLLRLIGIFLNGCLITQLHVQYQWNLLPKCRDFHGSLNYGPNIQQEIKIFL